MQHSRFRSGSFVVILALACATGLGLNGCAGMDSAPAPGPAVALDKTYWRLVEIEDLSVPAGAGRREPHIQFDPEKKRVTGYSGVNIFSGGYDTNGGGLRMTQMASTRRAGPPELMKLETALLKALSATRSYRVSGDKLEFLDTGGRILARFEGQKSP